MKVAKGRLNWGVFFILLGAVPLAYHQGVVTQSQLGDVWRLWPLVVVGIGVGFILSRTPAYFVGGLIVAATFGLMFGSLFTIGPNVGCGHNGGPATTASQSGAFDGPASVDLTLQCGTAVVTASSDGQWHVDTASTAGHNASITSTPTSVAVKTDQSGSHWFDLGFDTWTVALPGQSQLSLHADMDLGDARYDLRGATLTSATFNMNLGNLRVDLTGASVQNLTVETNLGAAAVELDAATDLTADLKTSLGSLKVCVPSELGVQVKSTDSLSSTDLGHFGMVRVGDLWQSPNYQTAAHKASLTVNTSLGSFELKSSGGCK
jgi:hypothetical protein